MPARLVERSDGRGGRSYPLNPGVTTIGRDEENDVVVASDHVSRRHAEVRWDGGGFILLDLGSKNGTLLNGRRVAVPEPLRGGDEITLPTAPAVTFVVAVTEETVTFASGAEPPEGVRIDTHAAAVYVDGGVVRVSAKEYRTLAQLDAREGGLVTKEELAEAVWPEYGGAVADYNIEQMISRLRRKLEVDPEQPRYLLTVRGLGYRLVRRPG
jgi:hypothetical protein